MNKDKSYLSYCPKCGYQGIYETGNEKCPFCQTKEEPTKYDWDEWLWGNKYPSDLEQIIFDTYVKPNPLFNEEMYRQRINKEKINNLSSVLSSAHTPHCPTCNSTNLSKITIAKKATKIALFGIFGMGDNGKTWKCNNCGSKF